MCILIKPNVYAFTALRLHLSNWHITIGGYEFQRDEERDKGKYYFYFCLVPCKNKNIYIYDGKYANRHVMTGGVI